ncbi:type IV pilus modification protein PilV [Dyella jejuensis]|uniref:Type IV pilus modification protein PilV n=1 Tax=Dyella jejuensis TaxID=1432009 RepID=A0ABW8JD96_9GAMM
MLPGPRQRGVTLIEVLVAMLVFGIGLLGVAGLLLLSARANHAAYLRTQVTFLAQGMADRMQANPVGVWNGDYNGVYPDTAAQDCAAGCTPHQLALHDRGRWSSQLATFLPPDAKADIACDSHGLAYVPSAEQRLLRPPFGGNCAMTITWTEQGVGAGASEAGDHAPQTFAWTFQP